MNGEPLSVEGQKRRDQILLLATAEARRRRRRRFTSRGIGLAALLAVAILVFDRTRSTKVAPAHTPLVARLPKPSNPPPPVAIEYVQTDPTITERLTIPTQPPRWTSIGDAELLQELAAAGQPAGIAWIDGKTILLPREPMR